jgi:hypothetical protein
MKRTFKNPCYGCIVSMTCDRVCNCKKFNRFYSNHSKLHFPIYQKYKLPMPHHRKLNVHDIIQFPTPTDKPYILVSPYLKSIMYTDVNVFFNMEDGSVIPLVKVK